MPQTLQTYAGVEVSAHLRFENGRIWEASLLGFLIATGRQTLDPQGSTMTIETHEIKPRGQMKSIAVWEKQKGRTSER